jgi:hypothetical protein
MCRSRQLSPFINLTELGFIPLITFRRWASAAIAVCRDVENFGTKTVSHNSILIIAIS